MKVTRDQIDPQLRFRGRLMGLVAKNMSVEEIQRAYLKPPFFQRVLFKLLRSKPRDLRISEEWISRPDGSKLRILIIAPLQPKQNVPGILRIHGGGYHMGAPEDDVGACREFITISNCVCVAPDYRLSAEAPYPAALEDCYTALLWLKNNADHLGVRDDQIAVAGASAGGGLTAALSLYARDKAEVNIAFQMPLCPMIDDRMETASAKDNDAPVWDHITCRSSWEVYLGDLFGTDNIPPYAAPARATDYSNLPPTFSYVGGIEISRDETVQYIENLRAAGVPAELEIYEGCYHGFDAIVPHADASRRFRARRQEWFQKAIKQYFAVQPLKGAPKLERLIK